MNSNEILAALRKAAEKPFVETSQTSKAVNCEFCDCKEIGKSGITKMTTLDGEVVLDLTVNPPIFLLHSFYVGHKFDLDGYPCEIIEIADNKKANTLYKVLYKGAELHMTKAQLSKLKEIDNE